MLFNKFVNWLPPCSVALSIIIKRCFLGYYNPFSYTNALQTQWFMIRSSSKLFKLTELCYTVILCPFHLSRSLSKINVNARSFWTGSNVNRGSIFVQNWLPSRTTRRWICSNLDCGRSGVEQYWPTSADNIIRGFQNRLFKRRKTGRKFRERSWYHAVFCEKSS